MNFVRLGWIVFLAAIPSLLSAQSGTSADTSGSARRLKELRAQIQQLESEIATSRAQETDLLSELDNLDQSISLRQLVIKTLSREREQLETDIQQTGRQIQRRYRELSRLQGDRTATKRQVDALQDVVVRRALYMYKHWNVDRWTVLLRARSLPELLSRQYYFRKIHHWDVRHIAELTEQVDSLAAIESRIEAERLDLQSDLGRQETSRNEKERLLTQKRGEESALVRKKSDRARVLADVRNDREALKRQLEETRQAAQEIEKQIAALAARPSPAVPPPGYFASGQPFAALKGNLPWPVTGRVVARFGPYKHPILGTVTDNTGIDIEAAKGTPVRAASDAMVGMVTWLRGFGNTVILDHRDGYYSVYAHLDEVNVARNDWLRAGDAIGTVGETGSLVGSRLHFEIWNKRDIQNPELWLARSPYP